MRSATRAALLTFGSLALVVTLSGCAGRSWQFWKTSSETPKEPEVATARPAAAPAATPAPSAETAAPALSASGFVELPQLTDVRFKPGLVTIGQTDIATLDTVVRWLKTNPNTVVRIEGHTDDLGTQMENLAVGQKRAASVMRYLVSKGLDPERISIVSYGSDRPLCVEKTEACRAKNRRAHFLVKRP
jgi:peptidoglycan-associated lipoprotein